MLRAMDSAVAGLRAHQNKLDVIGNNIANVNTFGFKAQSYSFKEAMYQTSSSSTGGVRGAAGGSNAAQYGFGTVMGSISSDMSSSTPSYVGGLNASVNGEGFFITMSTVKDGIDPTKLKDTDFDYTRVGQFSVDSNGYLVDSNGNFVYGFTADNSVTPPTYATTLSPIRAPLSNGTDPEQLSNVQINSLGEVTATIKGGTNDGKSMSLGKAGIASFQNPGGLTRKGGNYYGASNSDNSGLCSATVPGGSTSSLMTGYLEASNVDLAKEFSDMIMTQRGFQANSKIITVSDEILSDLVNMKR